MQCRAYEFKYIDIVSRLCKELPRINPSGELPVRLNSQIDTT